MYCPKCGMENPEGARICVSCGMMLGAAAPMPQEGQQAVKTSGLAITSLVLALLSPVTCLITALPAIIFGIVALVKISHSAGRLKGMGLAIAGIAVPVAAIPITAMLMAILMPALSKVKALSYREICGTHLSGLGRAMSVYAAENKEQFPTSTEWCDLLTQYGEVDKETFKCRGAPELECAYAMNKNVDGLGTKAPGDMVLLFESDAGWNAAGGPELLTTEHHGGEGCTLVFVDSHVKFVRTEDLGNLTWNAP